MTSTTTHRTVTNVAALMLVVAASLAVVSSIHLFGHVTGRSKPYDPTDAGVAEAIIGVVLVAGAIDMLRTPSRARTIGLAATAFAVVGFLIGVSITATSGHAPDIAYHATVLPFLIGGFAVLARRR